MSDDKKRPRIIYAAELPIRDKLFRKPQFWVVTGIILLIGLTVWYAWPDTGPKTSKLAQNKYQQTEFEAAQLRRNKQYDQAADKLEQFASDTKDTQLKLDALTEAATLYETQGKYGPALEKYKTIELMNKAKNKPELMGVARCAQALKDYDTALAYYQKALAALPKDSPTYAADSKGLEQVIKDVRALKEKR